VADRAKEYLAPSDRGVIMLRRRFLQDLERLKEGRDPKAIVRDPEKNRAIELPVAERRNFIEGFPRAELLRDPFSRRNLQGYIFQTGQPPQVREAFLAAMGFTEAELDPEPSAFDPLAPAPRRV
jgi:5,5'-dehydrodivanillate O-demethylase